MAEWSIEFTSAAAKSLAKMPKRVQLATAALVAELEVSGPALHGKGWKNFGKLRGHPNRYHCHVKAGRPTYVVCWEVVSQSVRLIEVYYVGTHEKAPY